MWRIVQALDGGISRIKLDAGTLSAAQAEAVADAAERFAGGVIEVTNRSNLQIRGIGADHAGLVACLLDAGLGPRQAAGDDVRNLMLSPAAGLDRAQLFDSRALAGQILASLQTTERFHQLSAKFAVQLDAGEDLAMLTHPHDLWLAADDEGEISFDSEPEVEWSTQLWLELLAPLAPALATARTAAIRSMPWRCRAGAVARR